MADLSYIVTQVKDRIPISDIVRATVNLRRQGRVWGGLCPFHNEKSPSFTVNDEKGFYHCFGCGAHGDIISFLTETQNLSFIEALEKLASSIGLTLPEQKLSSNFSQKIKEESNQVLNALKTAAEFFQNQLKTPTGYQALEYMKSRGLTHTTQKDFNLGYAPSNGLVDYLIKNGFSKETLIKAGLVAERDQDKSLYDRFRNRLIFPIYNPRNEIIGFGGRLLQEGLPKYLNSPETDFFNKSRTLYGFNKAKTALKENLSFIVVEGYMDVITLHQAGFETAVAPLGTALTIEQTRLLWKYDPHPIVCFDGDNAGKKAALRIAYQALELLEPGKTLRFCFLPEGEDPDSFLQKAKGGHAEFREFLKSSLALSDVIWMSLTQSYGIKTPEEKAFFKQHILDILKVIPNNTIQQFYIQDFKDRYYNLLNALKPSFKPKTFKKSDSPSKKDLFNIPAQEIKNLSFKRQRLPYDILMATLINHPDLLGDLIEELASLPLSDSKLQKLRDDLINLSTLNNEKNSEDLKKELQQLGHNDLLLEILSDHTYVHAQFAHPDSNQSDALKGWQDIQTMLHKREEITTLTQKIIHETTSDFDEKEWQYLKSMKINLISNI